MIGVNSRGISVYPEFRAKLEQKLRENIAKRSEELTHGVRRKQYWGVVGAIQALRGVIDLLDVVEKELNP
jgi:hypothetical protein